MSFFQDFLVQLEREMLFDWIKWIGIGTKWLFYLGKKPIATIRKENWNRRIGFIVLVCLFF